MDEHNSFLNSYKKNMETRDDDINTEAPVVQNKEAAVEEKPQAGLHYEEKSSFIKPKRMDIGLPPSPPKRPKWLAPVIAGAVILLIAVVVLLLLLNQGVEVIDFTGWTKTDAQTWASQAGVRLQIEEVYNDEIEAGKVVSQGLPKGSRVKKGDFLKLTVSLGHDLTVMLPLPDIMNMTKEEVEAWAAENFMAKVRITAEFSETVPLGKVIRYEVNDPTVVDQVSRNTPIYVIVSKGKEDLSAVTVTIPNFKEKTISESYIFANENGLVLKVEEQYDDYVPKGSIISQSVKADEKVPKGSEITLIVSKGKLITVPSFSGLTKEKAAAVAAELNIPVTIKEKYSGSSAGRFISQSIPAGSEYEDGEILELTYSLGNKIVLASFVGQTRDAIESWAKDYNERGASISIKATETNSNSPKGTIIYQSPANKSIGIRTTIYITVSKGKVVFVPDFVVGSGTRYDVAITREEAIAMCEELHLVPVFVKESHSGRLPGEIWYQSIAAGKETTEGTKITLKYVPTATDDVPNFIGMTQAQAEAYLNIFDITFVEEYKAGSETFVHKQSLPAGTVVAKGTKIALTISPAAP